MAQGGRKNILISNEVVGLKKLQLLAGLARYCNMIVAVDNFKNSSNISKAAKKIGVNIGVLVDLDVGLKRCGVRQVDDAVELAKHVSTLSNVDFKGIMAYEGSMRGKTHEEKKRLAKISMAKAIESRDLIEAAGIPVEMVSAGGTATYDSTGLYSGVTEIQPGSYVLMETPYINEGLPFKPALTILATVISKSTDKLVLNVGRKGITRDQGMPELKDFPNSVINLHEEHCLVDMDEDVKSLDIGDKIQLLPSHCCTTVNLHEFYHCVRNGRVEAIWDIHARGKVR
jgi:D-serine deaminase-like pyridoxal phosphate-dependent protein